MTVPLVEDDFYAKLDEEREAVQAERERAERTEDFAPALYPPRPAPGGDAATSVDGGSSAHGGACELPWLLRAANIFCRDEAAEGCRGTDPCTASPPLDAAPVAGAGAAEGWQPVGTCSRCEGALVFNAARDCAVCPCGYCRVEIHSPANEERPAGPLAAGRSHQPKVEPSRWPATR